ncbi:hypothetical protein, partial [Glutamicibacter ardleyensis]|uniref:hypothetical protein n=1 Tax=Glutamicibacter ardleyensis TaxID=225894 RepID=UPI003FD11F95
MGTEWPGDERRKAKTDVLTVPNASDKPEASLQIHTTPEPVEPTAPEPTRAAPLVTGTPLVT